MTPTLGSMVDACSRNRDIAHQQLQRVQQTIDRCAPGEVTDDMRCQRARYRAELEHWSSYVGWYRQRIAREGAVAAVNLGGFAARTPASAQTAAPDMRLPREPGMDDDDEGAEGLPF